MTETTGLVTRRALLASGVTESAIRRQLRFGQLGRIARGVYVTPGSVIEVLDPRVVTRSWSVALSHVSAAAWWGADLPAPVTMLHVVAPRNRGHRRMHDTPGVRLHRADLPRSHVRTFGGVRVTTPLRTSLDVARSESIEHAVAVVDSLVRRRVLGLEQFVDAARGVPPAPGRHRLQLVAALVDPVSESVLESLARVLLWRRRILPPHPQFTVRDRCGRFVARVDFAWPGLKVALECDGFEFHSSREAFARDRRRWAALTRAGWRVIVVTWADVVGDPDYVAALVHDVLADRENNAA